MIDLDVFIYTVNHCISHVVSPAPLPPPSNLSILSANQPTLTPAPFNNTPGTTYSKTVPKNVPLVPMKSVQVQPYVMT